MKACFLYYIFGLSVWPAHSWVILNMVDLTVKTSTMFVGELEFSDIPIDTDSKLGEVIN